MTDRVCVAYHSREIDTRVSCPRRAVVEFGSVALCEEHLDVLESGRELKAAYCAAVLELAIRRGIRRWTDLSLHLKPHGYDFKPSRHSNWAYGRHAVDSTLPP